MLRGLLIIAVMLFGTAAACVDRFAGLLLYVWFALFRPQEWVWIDITSLRLSLGLGILLVVPSLLTGVFPNITHPLSVGALAFLSSALLAQFQAVRPDIGWAWIDYLARLIIVCLLAVTLIDSRKRFVQALAVISGSLGFHAAKAGLASLAGGGVKFYAGLAGSFQDNNGYAVGILMIVPLLVAVAQNADNAWVRRGFYFAAPLSAFTVISTFSRGGFLGLTAAVLTFALLQRRRGLWLLGLSAVAGIALSFVPLPEGWLDRINTVRTFEQVQDESAISRLHFWHVAVDMAMAEPLGVGLRNYEHAYDRYDFSLGAYGLKRAVHSSHFQVLAELGFTGALAYAGLFGAAFFFAFRARARSRDGDRAPEMQRLLFTAANGLIASMVGFLVGGAFIALALNDITWLTFALVAALDRLSSAKPATAVAVAARIARSDFTAVAVPHSALGAPQVAPR